MFEDMWILDLIMYFVMGLIVFVPLIYMGTEHIKRKNEEHKGFIRIPACILVKYYYNRKEES